MGERGYVTHEEFEAWRNRAAYLYLGLAIICVLCIALVARTVTDDSTDRLRAATHQTCDRGNIVRAFETVAAGWYITDPKERQQSAIALLPILDCDPLLSGHLPVPMAEDDARAYISGVALRMGAANWER